MIDNINKTLDTPYVALLGGSITLNGIACDVFHKRTLTALQGMGVIKRWGYEQKNGVMGLWIWLEPRLVLATAEKIKRNQRSASDE